MTKVSVVMATYNTGPRIEWTLSQLESQTMDTAEFEIVVVDDGSTDDTYRRLTSLSRAYPNLVVDRIDNSGWPGRPRNVGVGMASGEYIFFMDHDDTMFPEALERLYDFAVRSDADVVIPKEVVDGWKTPGWGTWRRNITRLKEVDAAALECLTPHKLYRRDYLLSAGIAFPEGRIRLEDFDFNAQAYARTDKIAVLADYPCYTWIVGDANSHRAGYDVEVYWKSFERSLQPIVMEVPAGDKHDAMLVRWYRSRLLERLNPQMLGFSDDWIRTLASHFRNLLPYFPERLDPQLTPADRMRSLLLRRGDWSGLTTLAELDRGIRPRVSEVRASWSGRRLNIECTGTLGGRAADALCVQVANGRVHRVLPRRLRLSPDQTDITDALKNARIDLIVRDRSEHVDWNLPTTWRFSVDPEASNASVTFTAEAELDITTAAFGSPLRPDVWDIVIRVEGLGWTPTAVRLGTPEPLTSLAVVDGRQIMLYTTTIGTLAIDLASEARNIVDLASPDGSNAVLQAVGDEVALRWPLPAVHVPAGDRSILDGGLVVGTRRHPARIVANAEGATLVSFFRLGDGEHEVRSQFGRLKSRPHLVVSRGSDGVPTTARSEVDGAAGASSPDRHPTPRPANHGRVQRPAVVPPTGRSAHIARLLVGLGRRMRRRLPRLR